MKKINAKLRKYGFVYNSSSYHTLSNSDKAFYDAETNSAEITPITDFPPIDQESNSQVRHIYIYNVYVHVRVG